MSDVDYIQKDKRNSFFNYSYASEAAIKSKLHELLVKHGLLFMPTAATIANRTEYTSDKGKHSFLTDVVLTYKFIDIDTGESIEAQVEGTGDDGADKGTYKAITGALKYALTSTFLIETGDDPEDDSKERTGSDTGLPTIQVGRNTYPSPKTTQNGYKATTGAAAKPLIGAITEAQTNYINDLAQQKQVSVEQAMDAGFGGLKPKTKAEAKELLDWLLSLKSVPNGQVDLEPREAQINYDPPQDIPFN